MRPPAWYIQKCLPKLPPGALWIAIAYGAHVIPASFLFYFFRILHATALCFCCLF